ncbi:MAG: hypothetical protein WBA93_30760 [Microcoleaceae cyanobacterium]
MCIFKNGQTYNAKQQFLCHECGRVFLKNPAKMVIDQATNDLAVFTSCRS